MTRSLRLSERAIICRNSWSTAYACTPVPSAIRFRSCGVGHRPRLGRLKNAAEIILAGQAQSLDNQKKMITSLLSG